MCDGKGGVTRDGITFTCCYNHYYNGSSCVRCLAGFYGTDCFKNCDNGFYGERCSYKCKCTAEQFCHHITGCIFGNSGRPEIPIRGYENSSTDHGSEISYRGNETSSTDHVPASSIPPVLSLTSTSPTTDNQFPLQTTIFIFAIGSVMALFLCIIVVQFCIKLRIKRKKYTQQISVKRKPVKEEETYNEISESLMGIEGDDSRNEQGHVGKYDELQATNQIAGVPYDKIKTQTHYQDISDSLIDSSCNSDSSNSNTSYLKPKTNESHSYIDVLESSTTKSEITIQNSPVNSTTDSSKMSTQYLDPIYSIHNDEIVLQSHEIGDNNDAYLDVTHDTFL
nr:multiple epidermal growth factor-like domains protein 10 [Crassostrea gigas]